MPSSKFKEMKSSSFEHGFKYISVDASQCTECSGVFPYVGGSFYELRVRQSSQHILFFLLSLLMRIDFICSMPVDLRKYRGIIDHCAVNQKSLALQKYQVTSTLNQAL